MGNIRPHVLSDNKCLEWVVDSRLTEENSLSPPEEKL